MKNTLCNIENMQNGSKSKLDTLKQIGKCRNNFRYILWTKTYNIKTIQHLEDNIEYLHDLRVKEVLLNKTEKYKH